MLRMSDFTLVFWGICTGFVNVAVAFLSNVCLSSYDALGHIISEAAATTTVCLLRWTIHLYFPNAGSAQHSNTQHSPKHLHTKVCHEH